MLTLLHVHTLHLVIATTGIKGLAHNVTSLLETIAGGLLIVFVGFKALAHIARDEFGKAIGLIAIALIPALFLFDPGVARTLLTDTIGSLTS